MGEISCYFRIDSECLGYIVYYFLENSRLDSYERADCVPVPGAPKRSRRVSRIVSAYGTGPPIRNREVLQARFLM